MTKQEEQLCETLLLLRQSNGLSVKELSRMTGLSCNTIYCLEKKKKVPSLKIIKKYESLFGVKASAILNFSETTSFATLSYRQKLTMVLKEICP